jgi:hypothetical protein
VLSRGGENVVLTIEHHNEDAGRRAAEKVERYEKVAREGYFRGWNVKSDALLVLVTFLHTAVGTAYTEAVRAYPALLRCKYLGRRFWTLRTQGDYGVWMELPSMKRLDLFEGAE